MRCGSYLLGVVFLVTGHALAAEPGAASPPPKPAPVAPVKPAPVKAAADAPPPEYYVEPGFAAPDAGVSPPPASAAPPAPPASADAPAPPPGPPPAAPEGSAQPIYEPPPPGFYPGDPVFEPPPPPEPRHVAPLTSLWLGARVGWFMPFGNAWARGTSDSVGNVNLKGVPWRDYVTAGPMFELDAGARLSRNYNLFLLWERAQLGAGRGDPNAGITKSTGGDSDFWGIGLRASSDPDHVGLVTELAIGYRRARAKYEGSEIQFTDSPFEARLGIGADIRLNRVVTLSPMFTLGVGSFGKIDRVSGGTVVDQTGVDDQADGHAWATLTFGGSFDVLSSKK